MRTIDRSTQFRRDYKREEKGYGAGEIEALLRSILVALNTDTALPERAHDHGLTGNWRGYRDCHVRPDLVLIYGKIGSDVLELRRLGSHSELRL